MKRFYDVAAHAPVERGYAITLDGRPVKTPKLAPLIVPAPGLADAIVGEWAAQSDAIRPATMPVTGLANAAIDLVGPDPVAFATPLAAYAESDLLCYRATEADLAQAEAAAWNPMLGWAEARYGVEFVLARGIVPVAQPPATLDRLRDALLTYDAFALSALAPIVTIGGSLVVALALAEGAFDVDPLWAAVNLDELWQEERWGTDDAAIASRAAKQREWATAARFLTLLRPATGG